MDKTTCCLLMIMAPTVYLILKLKYYGEIRYDILKIRKLEKFYKKNDVRKINRFFLWTFRKRIPLFVFIVHTLVALSLIIGVLLAIIYFVVLFLDYELKYPQIVGFTAYYCSFMYVIWFIRRILIKLFYK